tara:strand:+ start:15 stop:1241 length:1227 start_codon:yes stop_codon:yes gene_type:complete
MGTTSSFFGGGGGTVDANKKTARPSSFTNLSFATNTQYSVSTSSGRGIGPKIIPNTDTSFWLLEGNGNSDVYASYWTLDADTGGCTNTGSAVRINGCDEVGSASANGIDRLIVLGGTNYDKIYHVYFNGSSVSKSELYDASSTHQGGCITSCGLDGTLYGSMAISGSNSISYRVGAIRTDGTTYTSEIGSNIYNSNGVHRAIGTEDGIVSCGSNWNTERRISSMRIALEHHDASSTLNQLYGRNLDMDMSTAAWSSYTGSSDTPFMIPTEGGVSAWICDSSKKMTKFDLSPSYSGAVFANHTQPVSNSNSASISSNMNSFFGGGQGFSRQANGTYLHFIGSTSPSNYVTFSGGFGFKLPFYTGRLVGNPSNNAKAEKPSSAVVGNYVLKCFVDETSNKVNIDAWNFKG